MNPEDIFRVVASLGAYKLHTTVFSGNLKSLQPLIDRGANMSIDGVKYVLKKNRLNRLVKMYAVLIIYSLDRLSFPIAPHTKVVSLR